MTAYRRLRLPGGTYAFTLCLEARGSSLLTDRTDPVRHGLVRDPSDWPYLTVRDS